MQYLSPLGSYYKLAIEVENQIGKGWKYKINKALETIGYTFDRIPKIFITS